VLAGVVRSAPQGGYSQDRACLAPPHAVMAYYGGMASLRWAEGAGVEEGGGGGAEAVAGDKGPGDRHHLGVLGPAPTQLSRQR
jgi:hypothetical protein